MMADLYRKGGTCPELIHLHLQLRNNSDTLPFFTWTIHSYLTQVGSQNYADGAFLMYWPPDGLRPGLSEGWLRINRAGQPATCFFVLCRGVVGRPCCSTKTESVIDWYDDEGEAEDEPTFL